MVTAACGDESVVAPEAAVGEAAVGGAATVASAIGTDSTTGATIETNKDDYSPGEVVHLTGRGWAPNETVHLFMTEAPDTHGDVTQSVVADASGAFTLHFYDVQTHDLGVTFTLTATGATSGSKAVVVFTDGQPQSVTVTATMGTVAAGATASYGVDVDMVGNSSACTITLQLTTALPSGAVATFAGSNPVTLNPGNVDYSTSLTISTTAATPPGTYPFTVRVRGTSCLNNKDETGTGTLVVTAANIPPVLAAIGPKSVDEGSLLTFAATATDSDTPAQTLTFSLVGAPAGAAITSGGSFTWTPTDGPAQTATFVVKVTDSGSPARTDEESITVTVNNVAPATPTITAPSSVNESTMPFNFSASSNDVSSVDVSTGLTFAFSCDDGATFPNGFTTSSSGQCTAADGPGTVKIAVKAKDKDGAESLVAKHSVTVVNVAPTATLVVPTPSVNAGAQFVIKLVSPVDPSSADFTAGFKYAFDCGSGFTPYDTASTATCTAGLPPSMTVKGKIKDKNDDETTYTVSVAVSTVPPIANAGGSYSGNEGSAINISGSGSDPDGGSLTGIEWSSDAPVGRCSFADKNAMSTSVTCNDNGVWNLFLTVTDNENISTTSAAAKLTVANVAPATPTISGPSTVDENSVPFNFSASTTDVSSEDEAAGLTFAFSCDNGATFGAFSNLSSGQCPRADGPSTVKIAVKAMDKDLTVSPVAYHTVTVNNVAPTVTATNAPTSVNEGTSISFSATTVTDPSSVDQAAGFTFAYSCDGSSYVTDKAANYSHSCAALDGPSTVTVYVKAKDKDGGMSAAFSQQVSVLNVNPTATFPSVAPVDEGSPFTLTLTNAFDVPADLATLTYAFDCGTGTYKTPSTTASASCPTTDNGTPTVKGKVIDDDGGFTEYSTTVTVNNVVPAPPTINATSPVDENSVPFTFSASTTDVSSEDQAVGFKFAFSCDDGATFSSFPATLSQSGSGQCPRADGPSTVKIVVKAMDKNGGVSDPATKSVTINNVAPTVTATNAPASVNEGATIPFSATTVTDPSTADQTAGFTFAYSCDGATYGTYQPASYVHSCPALDGPSSVPVYIKAKDKDGGVSTAFSQQAAVNNVAPTLHAIGSTLALAAVNQTVNITLAFSDPAGANDTYKAVINWDDGNPVPTVTGDITSPATVSRTFSTAGVYRVCAKVQDSDLAESNELCYEYLVVYDPTGGFVTGGGWINSPAGAYPANTSLTGKATFGFVSKYLKGATTPTGNTEFHFHAASFDFTSSSYEWLVIAGARAQYKGDGTVKGRAGTVGFLLTAIDGAVNGGGGVDKFRIKIWDKGTGAVIYDNQIGQSEDSGAATALGGGSIVIHNK